MVKGFIKNDILLMTSDGLTNMVSDKELYEIAKKKTNLVVQELVDLANSRGGYDNITVIAVYEN